MADPTFYQVLTAAISDLADHGFDSMERVTMWSERLRLAAEKQAGSPRKIQELMREGLGAVYKRLVDRGEIARYHPGVSRFTIERLKPHMRAELDRRIMASAGLIRLNRDTAIANTLRRFQGWSTSIPAGGGKASKSKVKEDTKKALSSLPFIERRVLIDQGHKLKASISEIVAADGGAIAVRWRSHWRQSGYDYREDHKERDKEVYAIRDNWAIKKGLMKAGPNGFYDKVTTVGEEPFCRCWAEYIYAVRALPKDMITAKGAEALKELKSA